MENIVNSKINGTLKGYCVVEDSFVDKDSLIISSHIFNSRVGKNCTIGPNAHLRPNTVIQDNCKIGNFVEIKNSTIGSGTKISHLTYVGDAVIGRDCNIGCGVIFVNYNGKVKNKITIGNNVFIGCNCNLIAPLNIADNTYIAAGTTVTEDVKEGDFVIGRVRAEIKPNRAQKYLKERLWVYILEQTE